LRWQSQLKAILPQIPQYEIQFVRPKSDHPTPPIRRG
jgi:hypothetical protein